MAQAGTWVPEIHQPDSKKTLGVRPSCRNVPHTYRQSFENGDLHVASRGRLFFRASCALQIIYIEHSLVLVGQIRPTKWKNAPCNTRGWIGMSFQFIGIPKNLPSTVCRFFRWCEFLSAAFQGIGYPKIYQSLGLTQLDILQVDRNDPLEMLFCWQTSQQSTTNPSFVTCHFVGTVPCGFTGHLV